MFLHGSGFEAFGFRTLAFGPQNPSFSSVSVASASQVSLAWAIPLDQDVGIAPGATEAEDETTNASGNYYRVGDVGVQVYRNGTVISGWTAGGGTDHLTGRCRPVSQHLLHLHPRGPRQ